MKKNKNKGGRRSYEGARHTYHVADDAHEYIKSKGGGQWLTDTMRIMKTTEQHWKHLKQSDNETND